MEAKYFLNKISQYAEKQNKENNDKLKQAENNLNNLKMQVSSLIDRIKKLEKIVYALGINKINNKYFFTDNLNHDIGFFRGVCTFQEITANSYQASFLPNGMFGIRGGGTCGGDLIILIKDNSIVYSEKDMLSVSCIFKLKKIIKEFDKFEQSVYSYVNSL